MERVILARHAQSVFNVHGVLNGDPSIPGGLTDEGRAQARRLGERLRGERIDLCVTTEFERTRETADIALADRDVPRLVVPDLGDPPNGDLELRPYAELVRWREANGPDVPLPGLDRTERDYFETVAGASDRSSSGRSPPSSAILHGYVIAWIASSVGRIRGWATRRRVPLTAQELSRRSMRSRTMCSARWSWETSGRPLLFGVGEPG